jgi:hypothetical protein
MESFVAAFAVGALWWYVLSGAWLIWMIWAVDHERIFGSAFALVLYLVFLQFISRVGMEQVFIKYHPGAVLVTILLYVVLGVVWSFFKWWLHVNEVVDGLKEERMRFLQRMKTKSGPHNADLEGLDISEDTPVPDSLKEGWQKEVNYSLPKVSESKGRIAMWITYWPISALWSLIDDLIHKLAKRIVEYFRTWYEAIAKRALKRIEIEKI